MGCTSTKAADAAEPEDSEAMPEEEEDEEKYVEPTQRLKAAILGSFVGDAYALGYHWVYDVSRIPHPVPPQLTDPASQFHAGKKKGQFTQEGDQALLLLNSVVANKKFDLKEYANRFQTYFDDAYKGWFTHAMKHVLAQLRNGTSAKECGSDVDDFSPIGRIAPLLLVAENMQDFMKLSKKYVKFTHCDPTVLSVTEFIAHVVYTVMNDHKSPVDVINTLIGQPPYSDNQVLTKAVANGFNSKSTDTIEAIQHFGQACSLTSCLPGVFHLLAKYERSLTKALEANVGAGGDSSARGVVVGMILGAHVGVEGLPTYTSEMGEYGTIDAAIDQFVVKKQQVVMQQAQEEQKQQQIQQAANRTRLSTLIN